MNKKPSQEESQQSHSANEDEKLFTVKSEQLEIPDESWDVARLGEFAKGEEETIRLYEKRMALHVLRLGRALSIAKKKVENGQWKASKKWCDFLRRYKISVTSDSRARTLFEKTGGDEKKVQRLGISEAYRKYDILQPPENAAPAPPRKKAKKKEEPGDDPPPPPVKEDPKTLTMFLAQVLQRLEFFFDEAAFVGQDKKESPEHCRDLLDQVIAKLQKMKEMLPDAA